MKSFPLLKIYLQMLTSFATHDDEMQSNCLTKTNTVAKY